MRECFRWACKQNILGLSNHAALDRAADPMLGYSHEGILDRLTHAAVNEKNRCTIPNSQPFSRGPDPASASPDCRVEEQRPDRGLEQVRG